MPTLANLNGRSLNADPSVGLNRLLQVFGTGPQRAAQAKQEELVDIIAAPEGQELTDTQRAINQTLSALPGGDQAAIEATPGPTKQEKEAALLRLGSLNPQAAQDIRQTLNRGDKLRQAALQKEVESGVRLSTLVGNQKTLAGKRQVLSQIATEKAIKGEDLSRILELRGMPENQLNLELQRMKVAGADMKTLLTPTTSVQQISGAQGQPVAQQTVQRNPITGEEVVTKVEKSPLATEPKGDLAILNAQFAAGNITEEQFNIGVQNAKDKQKTSLLKNLASIGVDPNSPEGKQLVKDAILKPRVVIKENEGLFKLPQGFMLADATNPTKGVIPIPGGPKDNLSGESAGKAQMLRTAQKGAKGLNKLVFKVGDDGKLTNEIDAINLVNAQLNTPGTKGRELRQQMEFGIQAITRIETGAAMPAEELNNTRARFMPTPFDSDRIVKLKLEMFNDFIGGALKLLDPTGRFNDERFQSELEERQGGKTSPAPAPGSTGRVGKFTFTVK